MGAGTPGERGAPRLPATGEAGPDAHVGAVEGDRPGDRQHANRNLPALDGQGLPADLIKICEDVLGANVDHTQG